MAWSSSSAATPTLCTPKGQWSSAEDHCVGAAVHHLLRHDRHHAPGIVVVRPGRAQPVSAAMTSLNESESSAFHAP